MKVEIWSDVVCPGCYIGKRRFERALGPEGRTTSRSTGAPSSSARAATRRATPRRVPGRELRTTVDQVHQLNERVVSLVGRGLAYDFDRHRHNAAAPGRVAYLGKAHGLEDAIQERLLRGQPWRRGADDPETLARLGSEVGIPPRRCRRRSSDAYAGVQADIDEAHALGIGGVRSS
jgi:predicted DsbA family dithiol-disulfide isomerase